MAQFQFKEGLILDFGNVQYELHPDDPDFLQTYEEQCSSFVQLGNALKKSDKEDPVGTVKRGCEAVKNAIEQLLGDGAVSDIFGDRPLGFYDLVDVFTYLSNSVNEYRAQRQASITPAPQNREQRRAAAKASRPPAKKVVKLPEAEK